MTQRTGTVAAKFFRLDDTTYSNTLQAGTLTAQRTTTFGDASGTVLSTGCAVGFTTPANPTGTTSTTGVMMGLAGSFTPTVSTRALILVSGQMRNSVSGDGVTVQLRYGTGTAPANGAALTGTTVGNPQTCTAIANSQFDGFTVIGVVTGLTVGTAYWIDVSLAAVTGGTASAAGCTISVIEV